MPTSKKGRQTVRYSPAQKKNETPELLQLAGELHNHKILNQLHKYFRESNMKAFDATAEKVMRVQCGNPVVRSVIKEDQLISERDQVDAAIAEYFQGIYGSEDLPEETDEDRMMWERFNDAVGATRGMFTTQDVEEAMRASNFNKGLGPDGFDGTILQPGNSAHRLTQVVTGQILGLLGNPQKIPKYLYEGRLVPLSKNKGKDQAELKDIRPIVVRSHVAKIMEKAIMAKVAAEAPHLL